MVECLGEGPVSGREIPFLRHEHVDDLAELVDRPVQRDSLSGHFGVSLVDEPLIAGSVPAGSCRVDQQWSEPLHPPEHGHVINGEAAFGQQFFDVAVR
jgi:hypothetical protein